MAEIAKTEDGISPRFLLGELLLVTWAALANGDTGEPVSLAEFSDKSVQITGTFGVAGSVTLEGSNDLTSPSNWFPLTDPQGNAITVTAAALEQVMENVVWIRPSVTAGDGTTEMTVKLLCRKTRGRAY